MTPHRGINPWRRKCESRLKGADKKTREGALLLYRSFATSAAGGLDGGWAFEDTHASYVRLDGLLLGKDAPSVARYLVEDFTHYAAARKAPGRRALLLIDEFAALRLPEAAKAVEQVRSFGAAIWVGAQSNEGLHDDPHEAARLWNATATIIAHRVADPEAILDRAGTVQRPERSHQLDGHNPTGAGSLRMQHTRRIDPNDLRSLPPGVCWVIHGGKAAKTAVTRTTTKPAEVPPIRPDADQAHDRSVAPGAPKSPEPTGTRGDDDSWEEGAA